MEKQTKAIDIPFNRPDVYGALSIPVYHTAAYEFDTAADMSDAFTGRVAAPDYSRVMNPTVMYLEEKIRVITGGEKVYAFNSGMAAISNTLVALAGSGKNIVTSRHLFGNTYALITKSLKRYGVDAKLIDLTNLREVEHAIDENTCCVFMEVVTNPQCEVADIESLAKIAHKKGAVLVADTTAIPFTEFSSHSLGVDIEVFSSTKYVSGGATSIGGIVVDYGATEEFGKTLFNEMLFNFGAYMTPHAAYMQSLGLETLDARYKVQSANALDLAKRLQHLPQVKRVNYIGLEDNPYYEIARKQFGPTSGAMLTIDLEDKEACFKFINKLKLVHRATNLFDNKSLAIHPASTIFGNFTEEQKREMDLLDTTIRLSVGLENVKDIYEDIKQALEEF